ncbi:MAG: thioredoxin family protein [Gammaproteobacteria bacterium]|nr:thioredoxin family protein [Gammaproteobacteria bacterium]MCH9744238.1 thioredoxin family protein [Gammaproteobacteria bacterium]
MDNKIVALHNTNFDNVIEENGCVLIEFWAKWCVPCKNFRKVVEKLVDDYPQVKFTTVDIDEEKELADEFEVRSIPAIMVLRDQCVVSMETGAMSDANLRELLDQALKLDMSDMKQ